MKYPIIKFESFANQLAQGQPSCYVFGICEDQDTPVTAHLANEPLYQRVIIPLIEESKFTGKKGTVASANCFDNVGKVILVGLGNQAAVNTETIREAASHLYRASVALHSLAVAVDFAAFLENPAHLQAFAEGILLTAHCDERFKSKPDPKLTHLEQVYLRGAIVDTSAIASAQKITQGVCLARALVNAPANYVTPTVLAHTAKELAEKYDFQLTILEKEACEKLGMGSYLSVSQGSDSPPKFIHLCYKPKSIDSQATFKKVALIGKGVTFDSGGLNLKVGNSQIELMKFDMAGAAAVLGAAEAVGLIQPQKEIHFIIAATENMINGKATKPGDVVTASNGKTIEVANTDAEGRLTLADALVYAEKLGVDAIVDLATLTGSIVTALGERIAGLFGTDQVLVDGLMAAVPRTGEQIWRMPLEESYVEYMHSLTADLSNVAEKHGAGSITAALFLQQFVEKTPWAHIDIAGTVFTKKAYTYNNAGATGFGVRLLVDWLLNA